jgi:hypothetical protein
MATLISSITTIIIRSNDNEKDDQTANAPGQHYKRRLSVAVVHNNQGYG